MEWGSEKKIEDGNRENRGTSVFMDYGDRERVNGGARCRGNGTAVYVL